MRDSLLLPFATALLLLLPRPANAGGPAGCCGHHETAAQTARSVFADRVNHYVELHRTLAAPFGPEEMCSDPERLQERAAALAAAIRDARPWARVGELFTPAVASFLRGTVAAAAHPRYNVPALVDEMDEEGLPAPMGLEVNGAFPWNAGNLMPPGMLRALPGLPEELEYRFVGADLVLLDVPAGLIVDILEDALAVPPQSPAQPHRDVPEGAPTHPAHSGRDQPCDVHPEMPACWM